MAVAATITVVIKFYSTLYSPPVAKTGNSFILIQWSSILLSRSRTNKRFHWEGKL